MSVFVSFRYSFRRGHALSEGALLSFCPILCDTGRTLTGTSLGTRLRLVCRSCPPRLHYSGSLIYRFRDSCSGANISVSARLGGRDAEVPILGLDFGGIVRWPISQGTGWTQPRLECFSSFAEDSWYSTSMYCCGKLEAFEVVWPSQACALRLACSSVPNRHVWPPQACALRVACSSIPNRHLPSLSRRSPRWTSEPGTSFVRSSC